STLSMLSDDAGLANVACRQQIDGCKTKDELRAIPAQLATTIADKLAATQRQIQAHLGDQTLRAAREIEEAALQSLRERYQLLHEVTRTTATPIRLEANVSLAVHTADLPAQFEQAVRTFDRTRIGFGVGGAAAGAAAGTLLLPGLGSAAGALVGAFATFAR